MVRAKVIEGAQAGRRASARVAGSRRPSAARRVKQRNRRLAQEQSGPKGAPLRQKVRMQEPIDNMYATMNSRAAQGLRYKPNVAGPMRTVGRGVGRTALYGAGAVIAGSIIAGRDRGRQSLYGRGPGQYY